MRHIKLFENFEPEIPNNEIELAKKILDKLNPSQIEEIRREIEIGGVEGLAQKLKQATSCSVNTSENKADLLKKTSKVCFGLGSLLVVGGFIANLLMLSADPTGYEEPLPILHGMDYFINFAKAMAILLGPIASGVGIYQMGGYMGDKARREWAAKRDEMRGGRNRWTKEDEKDYDDFSKDML